MEEVKVKIEPEDDVAISEYDPNIQIKNEENEESPQFYDVNLAAIHVKTELSENVIIKEEPEEEAEDLERKKKEPEKKNESEKKEEPEENKEDPETKVESKTTKAEQKLHEVLLSSLASSSSSPSSSNKVSSSSNNSGLRCGHCNDLIVRNCRRYNMVEHFLNLHPDLMAVNCSYCSYKSKDVKQHVLHAKRSHPTQYSNNVKNGRHFRSGKFPQTDDFIFALLPDSCTVISVSILGSSVESLPEDIASDKSSFVRELLYQNFVFCWFCRVRFPRELDFRKHVEQRKCDKCSKMFPSVCQLEDHLTTHQKYKCAKCWMRFPSFAETKAHALQVHKKEVSGGRKPFTCDVCKNSFNILDELEKHKSRFHPSCKRFVCERCGLGFLVKEVLMKHQKKCDEPVKVTIFNESKPKQQYQHYFRFVNLKEQSSQKKQQTSDKAELPLILRRKRKNVEETIEDEPKLPLILRKKPQINPIKQKPVVQFKLSPVIKPKAPPVITAAGAAAAAAAKQPSSEYTLPERRKKPEINPVKQKPMAQFMLNPVIKPKPPPIITAAAAKQLSSEYTLPERNKKVSVTHSSVPLILKRSAPFKPSSKDFVCFKPKDEATSSSSSSCSSVASSNICLFRCDSMASMTQHELKCHSKSNKFQMQLKKIKLEVN